MISVIPQVRSTLPCHFCTLPVLSASLDFSLCCTQLFFHLHLLTFEFVLNDSPFSGEQARIASIHWLCSTPVACSFFRTATPHPYSFRGIGGRWFGAGIRLHGCIFPSELFLLSSCFFSTRCHWRLGEQINLRKSICLAWIPELLGFLVT